VKPPALAFGSHSFIYLAFEVGELRFGRDHGAQCAVRDCAPSPGALEALRLSIALPDALGGRACRERGHPDILLEAAKLYNFKWKPEADAVSWISEKNLFENRFHEFRTQIAMRLGVRVVEQAKSADVPYSEVRRKAERLWPLWVK
jgi:hypothetical protein